MPHGKRNWTFKDIVKVLTKNGFQHTHAEGSHYYYKGIVGGTERMTHVQFHGSSVIPPKTVGMIMKQSGIPPQKWVEKK